MDAPSMRSLQAACQLPHIKLHPALKKNQPANAMRLASLGRQSLRLRPAQIPAAAFS